jgi:hypothetical protein
MRESMHTEEAGEDMLNASCRLAIPFSLLPSSLARNTISLSFSAKVYRVTRGPFLYNVETKYDQGHKQGH